jgi:hypothetical protein
VMQRKDDIDRRVCMAQREHTCFNAATTTTTSMPPRLRWGFPPASAHWLWSAPSSRAVAAKTGSSTRCWQHSRMRPGACCSACVRAQFCIPSCSEARRSRRVCVCVCLCARAIAGWWCSRAHTGSCLAVRVTPLARNTTRQQQRLRESAAPCRSRRRFAFSAARRGGALSRHSTSRWIELDECHCCRPTSATACRVSPHGRPL